MSRNISFQEAKPEEYNCGITVGSSFKIMSNRTHVGYICFSNLVDGTLFMEWVELFPQFRNQGFFREIFTYIKTHFGRESIKFETSEEYLQMYKHMGATECEYDEFREMTTMEMTLQ